MSSSALTVDGPAGLRVALLFGDVEYDATIDFVESRAAWRYHATARAAVPAPPDASPVAEGPNVSFRLLDAQDQGGSWFPRALAVRSSEAFGRIWSSRSRGDPVLPAVDFSTEMVIFVDLGRRPSSAYTFDVNSVAATTCGLVVDYQETCGNVGTALDTFRWAAVAVPLMPGSVTWNRTTVGPCPESR